MSMSIKPETNDPIEELIQSSWEQPPADLQQRVMAIPRELTGPQPLHIGFRETALNFIAYVVIYTWLIGMFMIFKSTLTASFKKIGLILQDLLPGLPMPEYGGWILAGIVLLIASFAALSMVSPAPARSDTHRG